MKLNLFRRDTLETIISKLTLKSEAKSIINGSLKPIQLLKLVKLEKPIRISRSILEMSGEN